MNTQEVANAFTALCKAGQFDEAGQQFWADNVVSVEAMEGEGARVEGRKGVEAKGEWWYANHEVHSVGRRAVRQRQPVHRALHHGRHAQGRPANLGMDEMGVYTVQDGKVTEERFFYGS
jgi:hypothetical protein